MQSKMDFHRLRMSGFKGYLARYNVQKQELAEQLPQLDLMKMLKHYVLHGELGDDLNNFPSTHYVELRDLIDTLDTLLYKSNEKNPSWL